MKNYYKILGVKKDASEEEIREHWVELMRKLHPDQRIEGTAEDERIKEINEAYQVLKHSSTRVEYDLKRAYDQRKRNSYLRRLSIPIAIFVVLVMIGTIYLRKSQITLQANLPTRDRTNPIDQTDQKSVISDQRAVISYQTNQTNQIDQTKPTYPVNAKEPSTLSHIHAFTHESNDSIDAKMERRNDPSSRRRIHASTPQRDDAINQKKPKDATAQTRYDSIDPTTERNVQTVFNDPNDPNDPNVPHMAVSTKKPNDATNPKDAPNDLNDPNDLNVVRIAASPPNRIEASTHLIATEEEVRQFFANYTDRYTQKDLDSFISLFSSRAVQNRQDGLDGIRRIYGNFLNQSQEIKYHMENISIEIYQNGIEVKARYELAQMMKKSGDKRIWRGNIRWSLIKEDGALKILSLDYQHQKSP